MIDFAKKIFVHGQVIGYEQLYKHASAKLYIIANQRDSRVSIKTIQDYFRWYFSPIAMKFVRQKLHFAIHNSIFS